MKIEDYRNYNIELVSKYPDFFFFHEPEDWENIDPSSSFLKDYVCINFPKFPKLFKSDGYRLWSLEDVVNDRFGTIQFRWADIDYDRVLDEIKPVDRVINRMWLWKLTKEKLDEIIVNIFDQYKEAQKKQIKFKLKGLKCRNSGV